MWELKIYKENRHFSVRYFPTGDEQDLTEFLKFYLDTTDIFIGIIVECFIAIWLYYEQIANGVAEGTFSLKDPLSPSIMLASICIFKNLCFSNMYFYFTFTISTIFM